MSDRYSIDEIEEFHKLKTRESQLLEWRNSIDEEIERLERQKKHQQDELKEIHTALKAKFSKLEAKADLFNVGFGDDAKLPPENVKKGMGREAKKRLLSTIIGEYLAIHEQDDKVPFGWIKDHLAEKYSITCKSISNYFVGILDEYKLVGGNRNKAIKVVK